MDEIAKAIIFSGWMVAWAIWIQTLLFIILSACWMYLYVGRKK